MKLNNKQKGFSILAVILVIVTVIVAIGIWVLSGQTNVSNNTNSNLDVQATSLINDALTFKQKFDEYKIKGASQNSIVFIPNAASTSSSFNLLDPTLGVPNKTPNANVVKANPSPVEGYWVYISKAATTLGLTITVNDMEKMIVIGGIKDSVCKRINYILTGSESIMNFMQGSDNLLDPSITKAAPSSSQTLYFPPMPGPTMTTSGCGGSPASPDSNLFYMVLQVN